MIHILIEKDCAVCSGMGKKSGGYGGTCERCKGSGVERGSITLKRLAEMIGDRVQDDNAKTSCPHEGCDVCRATFGSRSE